MPELKLLFLQMAVILTTARLMAAAFRFAGQPAVVGEMAAGILLGPSLLGRISPAIMNSLFPADGLAPLSALSQVGLILFMFLIGIEVRPASLRSTAKSVILASQASIVAPLLLGGALASELHSRLSSGAPRLPFVLFLATAMGVTAFPVLARILAERGLMHTRVGVFAVSCAAFDDLTAWCLLAVVTVIARPEATQNPLPWRFAALLGYILAMVFLVRPVFRLLLPATAKPGPCRFGAAMILLLFSAWANEALAVHALFGAFLAGLVIPKGGKLEQDLHERLESVTVVLLLPLFFAFTGPRTSIGLLNHPRLWLLCGLIVIVAIVSKLLVSAVVVHASGMPWRESLAVGVLVNTKGLVELVILNVGLDLHILSPTLFSMMVIMALATTLMTTPLLD
ncbi:MAG: cation:proton antiporter [Candidatus Sulfopaludibacter sp.]|nr:cation:proton antiporter [Candidatus Sulfopaludibacter sp.]